MEPVAVVRRHPKAWTDDEIAVAIRTWSEWAGRRPRKTDFEPPLEADEPERPAASTVLGHFGTWPAALKAAGFTGMLAKSERREEVIEVLPGSVQEIAAHLGRAPRGVRSLLWRMARDGDVVKAPDGRYHPAVEVDGPQAEVAA